MRDLDETVNEDSKRKGARAPAARSLARGDATGWFEELYATASSANDVPWADLTPNPTLVSWLTQYGAKALDGAPSRSVPASGTIRKLSHIMGSR
jgi:hypothetical protein